MSMFAWRPYVPVARRRSDALKKMDQLRKQGRNIQPVEIEGRTIARTFWGNAWCDHMESLGDYANRLPRGRTYVRNGSVCHLAIEKGRIDAMVSGSEIYTIRAEIDTLPEPQWKRLLQRCTGQVGSLLELLQGKLSAEVMRIVTDSEDGLFPLSRNIRFKCSCPDWASLCKHVAAVLYGAGARLDQRPELLFLLRGVNHEDLVMTSQDEHTLALTNRGGRRRTVANGDLANVFGIDLEEASETPAEQPEIPAPRGRSRKKEAQRSSSAKKKTPAKAAEVQTLPASPKARQRKKRTPRKRAGTSPAAG